MAVNAVRIFTYGSADLFGSSQNNRYNIIELMINTGKTEKENDKIDE